MNFIISYPKSGRTWLRFMLNACLCRLCEVDLPNVFEIEKKLAEKYPFQWTHLTGAMVMKLPYYSMGNFDRTLLSGASCILVTRSIHATLASAYHQAVSRIKVFNGTPSEFLRSPKFGAIKIITFYNLWEELHPSLQRWEMAHYEDMLEDPAPILKTILDMFDMTLDDEMIQNIVSQASFDKMKQLSTTPAYAGSVIAPVEPGNPDSSKIRRGGDGGFRELFSLQDIAYIDRLIDDLLAERFRKCLSASVVSDPACLVS